MDLAIVCPLSTGLADTTQNQNYKERETSAGVFAPTQISLFAFSGICQWSIGQHLRCWAGLQHLPLESLVPLKWINQFLMPDIKTLTKCMWLSTPLILAIVLN